MLLKDKNAVIYGGGGSIGGAVAKEFAREGARVFLVGRTRESLERVANDIEAAGGSAKVAVLDASTSGPSTGTLGRWSRRRVASTSPSTSSRAATCKGCPWWT